jgi:sugar phosphate isomerase/epimerase
MSTRRTFIATASTAAASMLAFSPSLFAGREGQKLKNIGFIAGIIGKELKGDWKAVLKKTVEYGFNEMEPGNYLGDSAASFLAFCKEIGIKPVAKGISFNAKEDVLKKEIESIHELEIRNAILYWPWLVGGPFGLEDCKKSAEILNKTGTICKDNGLTLCWHNHNKEFIPMEAGLPFDYLMSHTDKELVQCELDLYWVAKGGADPLAVLKKYKGRVKILHVKDMAPGVEQIFECPGSGIIDFPSIFKEALNQGIEHFIVEHDTVKDGMACLKTSGAYLRNLTIK